MYTNQLHIPLNNAELNPAKNQYYQVQFVIYQFGSADTCSDDYVNKNICRQMLRNYNLCPLIIF